MSLTAKKTGTLIGTAAIQNGTGSGVSNRELQGTATITYGGAPTSNTALSLPGTSGNYMNLGSTNPANINTSISNVFVEAWFYAFSYPSNTTFIIYKGGNNINSEDFGLWVSGLYGVNWRMWNTAGAGFAGVTGSNNLNVNQWYHVAGSWDVGTKTLYTFLNGTLLGPGTLTGTPRYSASSRVQIGAANSAGFLGDYYPFNGYIRDVRIVQGGIVPKTSFTPAAAPFGPGTPTYVLGMGTPVLSLYTQYFFPSWLSLPGSAGAYMDFSTVPVTRVNTSTTNMFLETWCYFNSLTGVEQYIAGVNTVSTQANDDWGLRWDSGINRIQFYHYNSGNTVAIATSLAAPPVLTWIHVAISVVTGNPGYLYLFINGVLQNTGGNSTSSTPRYTAASTFWIGSPGNTGWGPSNIIIQDLSITRGGTVPTTNFTPVSAPFSLLTPSYVPGGTCVLSLATQYFLNTLTNITPSGQAGGYGPNVTGGDQTQIIGSNKVHFFTTVGTTTVTVTGSGYVTVMVVAGGGGGGYDRAGGGGAGGLIFTQMILQPGTYTVTVGAGGAGRVGSNGNGANGENSVFGPLTAIGGGGGGSYADGFAGGSGGGGFGTNSAAGGARTADQGNVGGAGLNANLNSGGGGGANGAGVAGGNGLNAVGGNGGPGKLIAISGTPTYYAGGGGGSIAFDSFSGTSGNGLGGIGGGGNSGQVRGANGSAGTANTGGGGGGGANIPQGNGGNGGSGIVIISYPTSIPSQIRNNYLFSQISTSTMAAAYSLRSLTGGAVRAVNVRRSSDNATQDFLVDTAGNMFISLISRQSLESWLGNSTGFVTTWYDQTGLGRNATTNGTSPIVTGSLINSFYGLNFQSSAGLLTSAFTNSTTVTVVMVVVIKSTIATWGVFAHHGNRDLDWALEQNGTQPSFIHFQSNNDNTGNQLSIVYDTPMILYGTMTSGTAMTFQMITSAATYNTSTTVTLSSTVGSKVLYIGKSDVGESCNSYIGEFNYFSSILSASDSAKLIANIRSRWNI